MATGHTVKAFDDDLGQLRALVAEMGGRAEQALADAVQALVRRDLDAAVRIVEDDKRIDELEVEVERHAIRLIALRAPMADDLRDVLAAMKIAGVIERMGDYAKNIAKRIPVLSDIKGIEPISILPAMARSVSDMVHAVLDAYARRDAAGAVRVAESDRTVDDFYNSIFRALLTHMMENPHTITASTHLLFIAKNLERIGDHATNVAEMVYYAATGHQMAERARGGDPLAAEEE
ncbi:MULTISPECIES: phosphate signaling complex protein PhoU [Sphingomonadales]|uniref:Phosphate-specific transport system accessory protein PhoU n=2 Tax=Edaphosphingomonas TaxID=3423724 RepID=A0A2T4HU83_9SPHN|nr:MULTISPECIES: phosphate signaling complex protein PhoU [Sphingomonas]AGH48034.1 phosphate uptake regulator PhoU [Sphingomonas sp. MM-1]MDX3884965.1 phosphate signaling complex protein PhoU [Sphingomonas sp.]OHT20433.1 Phosphate-specific transport system accessory protein PhoU [Sphingomonas haloaromaticamans]PTD19364.1 phosphate transport system regulatory protein PhoU [Sphingomonas fennica]